MSTDESEAKQTPEKAAQDAEFTNAFVERARQLYMGLRANRETLLDFYNEGKQDELDEGIDSLADALMLEDESYKGLRKQLKEARASYNGKKEQEIVAQIRELQDNYRQMVIIDLNLPDKARLSKLDQAANDVKDFLAERGVSGQNPKEALQALGIIIPQEDGKTLYQFPAEFMTDDANTKWATYLSTVIAHYQAAAELTKGMGSQGEVVEADRTRKYAHDIVTKDVHHILGLNWDVADTRNLLASIRESVLPNEGSILSEDSQKLLEDHHGHVAASRLLSARHHT